MCGCVCAYCVCLLCSRCLYMLIKWNTTRQLHIPINLCTNQWISIGDTIEKPKTGFNESASQDLRALKQRTRSEQDPALRMWNGYNKQYLYNTTENTHPYFIVRVIFILILTDAQGRRGRKTPVPMFEISSKILFLAVLSYFHNKTCCLFSNPIILGNTPQRKYNWTINWLNKTWKIHIIKTHFSDHTRQSVFVCCQNLLNIEYWWNLVRAHTYFVFNELLHYRRLCV